MSLWSRFSRTLRPGRHTQEIEEELQYHLAMKEQDGYDARAARVRFGNTSLLKEETRAQGVFVWFESLLRDLRYGLRQLRRTPTLTLVVVFSLALGIGANSAIFSLVDAALLKPLPVRNPQSLRLIEWSTAEGWPGDLCHMHTGDTTGGANGPMRGSSIAPRIYRQLAAEQRGFASLIGFSDPDKAAVSIGSRAAEQFQLEYVSTNFFEGLGVLPRFGRSFSSRDDRAGAPPLVVISERFWRSRFGSRGDVLGHPIRINNVPAQVIGVAPPGFFGVQIGEWVDLYAPLSALNAISPRAKLDRLLNEADTWWWVRQMGRLKPGVSERQTVQQTSALFQHLVVPPNNRPVPGKIPQLIASQGVRGFDPIGNDKARALWILLLLVGLILLIVCANVANLLLSRAVARQRESAVCLALGAGRFRLVRQYLIESITLALAGGVLGLLLSHVLAEAIHSFIRADLNIGGFDLHVDARILIYTALISLSTVLLFGLAPAWQLSRASVNDALKAHGRTFAIGRLRFPRALVVVQIGLSLTVLVAAGLLGRSLANLATLDIGFDRNNLIYVSINPWSAGYQEQQVRQYLERLRAGLAAIPGISRVGVIQERPLSGGANSTWVNIPGQAFHEDDAHTVLINSTSDGAFETLGIPLLAGRTFQAGDMSPKSDAVIVDELFIHRFYAHQDPLGRQFGTGPKPTELYRIIGVVKNSRYNSLREAIQPTMYRPSSTALWPGFGINFVIRAVFPVRQLAGPIRQAAAAADPSVPIVEIKTQTALIDHLLLTERLLSILSGAFGVLALLLSAIGLIGLLAYAVARRTNEIGVRMALGASQSDVVQLVLKDSFWLVTLGICAGLPGAYFVGRLLKHTLFHLQPADPWTAGLSLVILAAIAALSAWLPARRAAQIDPMAALREE
jgi:predicted permease